MADLEVVVKYAVTCPYTSLEVLFFHVLPHPVDPDLQGW